VIEGGRSGSTGVDGAWGTGGGPLAARGEGPPRGLWSAAWCLWGRGRGRGVGGCGFRGPYTGTLGVDFGFGPPTVKEKELFWGGKKSGKKNNVVLNIFNKGRDPQDEVPGMLMMGGGTGLIGETENVTGGKTK